MYEMISLVGKLFVGQTDGLTPEELERATKVLNRLRRGMERRHGVPATKVFLNWYLSPVSDGGLRVSGKLLESYITTIANSSVEELALVINSLPGNVVETMVDSKPKGGADIILSIFSLQDQVSIKDLARYSAIALLKKKGGDMTDCLTRPVRSILKDAGMDLATAISFLQVIGNHYHFKPGNMSFSLLYVYEYLIGLNKPVGFQYARLDSGWVPTLIRAGLNVREILDFFPTKLGDPERVSNLSMEEMKQIAALIAYDEHGAYNDNKDLQAYCKIIGKREGLKYVLDYTHYYSTVEDVNWVIRHHESLSGEHKVEVLTTEGIKEVLVPVTDVVRYRGEAKGDPNMPKSFHACLEYFKPQFSRDAANLLGLDVPLPKPPFNLNHPDYRHIDSSSDLRIEGKRMKHCVGGYVSRVLERGSYIYHVTVKGLDDGVTVEIIPKGDGTYEVNQSMGRSNTRNEDVRQRTNQLLKEQNKW